MLRTEKEFTIEITPQLKKQLMHWASAQQSDMIWLDSNQYSDTYHRFEAVLAFLPASILKENVTDKAFEKLKAFINSTNDWIFGYLSYDLKNATEKLHSENFDGLKFPEIYFFQPQKIVFLVENKLIFSYLEEVSEEIDIDFEAFQKFDIPITIFPNRDHCEHTKNIKARLSKEEYLKCVNQMKEHIARGDIYEANFCQEFYAEGVKINPLEVYWQLNAISEPPFASFMKLGEHYLLSASPERYLQRSGNKIISQPIKGTAKRSDNTQTDSKLRTDLENNPKERSENIMIVDLVRNDLSHHAERGSVQVVELCKPCTFKQVHQLISTVQAQVRSDVHSVDVIRATFPMGSMTGAPKVSAMQIIENLEKTKRGLYSGAVGYFSPKADFDLNVVIRSIFYNAEQNYVSFSVGSAITSLSDAEKEYEECLIKAQAMSQVLEKTIF